MPLAALLLLAGQALGDPVLLERKICEREYTFCLSFTDPFPESSTPAEAGIVTRRTKLLVGATATLKPGAHVLVAGQRDGYVAVFDPVSGHEGCVLASALKIGPSAQVDDRHRWIGSWEKIGLRRKNRDGIDIRAGRGGKLRFVGDATWKGVASAPDDATNFGEIDARGPIRDGKVDITEAEPFVCRYSFRMIGNYLVVLDRDAESCNGYNVTFSGVYRRSPAR